LEQEESEIMEIWEGRGDGNLIRVKSRFTGYGSPDLTHSDTLLT
jgi:hypothetical protein